MVNLTFDNGTIENFTLVLSQRDYTHLGQISNVGGVKYKANLNGADELTFEVYKELDGNKEVLWDDIYDLRLIWIPELNAYFEIDVESTDTVNIVKNITATSLCESELSQTGLHDIEINTADDIAREDYDPMYPTVFYRPLNNLDPESDEYKKKKNSSLLHRIMDKVPAYSIGHVDETLMNLQRIFSISDTTLYDFMVGECSEQFNCLFQFDSATRTISAYDLKTTCHNDYCPYYLNTNHEYYSGNQHLRYRGLYNDRCPICGSTDISSFGEDTTVFVSTENLTDEVKFDTDVASLKNCFRLEAGDDNMTAAVINSNPNGTRYIYEFNNDSKKDMPEELVRLIESYNVLYDEYNNIRDMELNTSLIAAFNDLCSKYDNDLIYHRGDEWKQINPPVYGYKNLIPHYYNCIDFYQYLKSSLMPVVSIEKTTVEQEKQKLIQALMADRMVGVSTTPKVAATVTSAVQNLSKLYVNTGLVKVKAEADGWDPDNWSAWNGTITLTSFEDKTDTAVINVPVDTRGSLTVTLDFATFMDQKISKYIKRAKESVELYDVLKIKNIDDFEDQLKYYSAARLQSFHDALAAVIGILTEADQGHDGYDKKTFPIGEPVNPHDEGLYERSILDPFVYTLTADTSVVDGKDYYEKSLTTPKSVLYDDFYKNYYLKLQATERELNVRNLEIALVNGTQDANGNIQTNGMLQYIMESIIEVQKALNFKQYIYNNTTPNSYDLYNVYTTYIREDTYSNSNYISDDLNNDQLFENAGKFLEIAKDELHKSATYQHSITTNLNNLMAIKEFEPLLDKFNLGNWIRVQEDERVYRLRLISYTIDFDNVAKLDTEFSDVTITADGMNDVMSIIKQASSMASSYSYTQQQAETGSKVQTNYIDNWLQNGLNSALIRINNNDDEDISIDNTGILARSYDDVSDSHEPEQVRITHNVIAFTDDNWQSVKTSLGKFSMSHHVVDSDGLNTNKDAFSTYDEYGLVANAVLAGWVVGSYIEGGNIISSHFQTPGNDSYIDMSDDRSTAGKKNYIQFSAGNEIAFMVDKNGNAKISGDITANSGRIGAWNISEAGSGPYGDGGLYYLADGTTMGRGASALLSPKGYTTNVSAGTKVFGWTSQAGDLTKTWAFGVNENFGVTVDGGLFASNANITGTIYATAGDFGSGNNKIHVGTGCIYSGGKNGVDVNAAGFYVGVNGISCGARTTYGDGQTVSAFKVDTSGNLHASNAYIQGTLNSGSIKGSTYFQMTANVPDHPNHYSSLNWGYTWGDSLTVLATWEGAGVGTQRGNDNKRGVFVHYKNIEWYFGSSTPWYAEFTATDPSSDIRLKKNVEDMNGDSLRQLFLKIRPIYFDYINGSNNQIGLIAQDLQKELDKLNIDTSKYIYVNGEGYYQIDYTRLYRASMLATHYLYEDINNLQKQVDTLQKEISRLKGEK